MEEHETAWSLLRERCFGTYWLAGLTANLGWQIQLVGASWLMISLHAPTQYVALVQTSVALPVMLLSLPGGAISDIVGRRKVVLWSQVFLLAMSMLLAGAIYIGAADPITLLICTFLIGCGRAIYYPGWQSMVTELVSRRSIPQAIALNASNLNIARSFGPAVGGAIVATVGAFAAFALNAVTNLAVIAIARSWPKEPKEADLPSESFTSAVLAGVRYVVLTPTLVRITIRSGIFNVAAIVVLALLPLIAKERLNGGPEIFGLLLGFFGTGAVIGAFQLNAARRLMDLDRLLMTSQLLFCGAIIALALSHVLLVTAIACLVAGLGWTFVQVSLNSVIQTSSPRWVISRSNAVYQTMVFGGNAIGSFVWGLLAAANLQFALGGSALLMATGALLGVALKIGEFDNAGLDQIPHRIRPEPNLSLQPDDGPVVTTVRYVISEQDLPEFLTAMAKKRRHRLRDGASRWTLSRDIHAPNTWFERYTVSTWSQALHLHARRTVESAEIFKYIRSLHQEPGKPEVHYALDYHTSRPRNVPIISVSAYDV